MIKTISKCRLCDSPNIPIIWDFGISPLANAFKNKEDLEKPELEFPLRYFKCCECHSVQLADEIPSEILFENYSYESPPNLIPHFNELAKTTTEFLNIDKEHKIIDIGSNIGLLLQEFKNLGYRKCVGFEPCDRIAQKARDKGINTLIQFFNGGSAEEFALQYKRSELITCTNCFAHVSDLNEFIDGVTMVMADDGYFIFENAYLLNTLQNKDLGQAYFEHFYMHSIIPLEKLFKKHELELFRVEKIDVQMGSIRGYVKWANNKTKFDFPYEESPEAFIINETNMGLTDPDLSKFQEFKDKISKQKVKLIENLKSVKELNKSISIYAWPAKMTLVNKYFGLEKYIDYVIEESSIKTNKYCPGTKLEIKNLEYFKNNPTDICLIGAYNFADDIKRKNEWYKGEWIIPL